MPRKPGTENRERATIGRRKDKQNGGDSAAARRLRASIRADARYRSSRSPTPLTGLSTGRSAGPQRCYWPSAGSCGFLTARWLSGTRGRSRGIPVHGSRPACHRAFCSALSRSSRPVGAVAGAPLTKRLRRAIHLCRFRSESLRTAAPPTDEPATQRRPVAEEGAPHLRSPARAGDGPAEPPPSGPTAQRRAAPKSAEER